MIVPQTPRPEVGLAARSRYILIGLWIAIAVVLLAFTRVLLPFAVALVIAYLLEPLVTRIGRVKIKGRSPPRWVAVIALYLAFFFLIYVFALTVVPQLYGELAGLTREGKRFFNGLTPERIGEFSNGVERWLLSRGIPVELSPRDGAEIAQGGGYGLTFDLEHSLREGLGSLSAAMKTHFFDAVGVVQKFVGGVLGFVFKFFFILMVAAFLLIDWAGIGRFLRTLVPVERREAFNELLAAVDQKLSGVVRGQAIICLVNGVLTAIGLLIFKVPFVFVLSLIATVLSAIPIFGSILSSVPIVLIAMTRGLDSAFAILAWIIGIHALEAYVLNPKIMGAQAHIHPVLVAFSLLAGEATFGFTGALFAVPVAAILLSVFHALHARALRAQVEPPVQPPTPQ